MEWRDCDGAHYILDGYYSQEQLIKTFRKKLRRLPYGVTRNDWGAGHCGFDLATENGLTPWREIRRKL